MRVCVAGATGWAGKAVVNAILEAPDLRLVGAVSRRSAGTDLGTLLGKNPLGVRISADVQTALSTATDVLIDYTAPAAVKSNVLAALARGVAAVIGTSGLTAADFQEIETAAAASGLGVIASGNFSITAALATHFALVAARYLPHWEILDYAHADKVDVPSGSTRELAERLETVRENRVIRPVGELVGPAAARGANIAGSPVHSIRLPSYIISFETIFGMPDERLSIRHDAGPSADPYVAGTLLAARKVREVRGLIRGLDRLMFAPSLVPWSLAALAFALPAAAQQIDTARALGALRDAAAVCQADGGALWGRTLCGPIALVDRQSRLLIANDTVAGQHSLRLGDAYVTTLPQKQFIANTSFEWGAREWTMVMLPLPQDRFTRTALVMHEVFHREQGALGLRQVDALNNQLDMRDGRTWLRLEYRALARAVESLPADLVAARHHAESAMFFRARRRALYPGSDSLEATLEIQEGLCEYTGQKLAMQLTGEGTARVARFVREYERTPTFVRAFAYGTGPGLGVLLDQFAPDWRTAIRTRRDPGALLAEAIQLQLPRDLPSVARARADEYGWMEVDREEAARDSLRAPAMRDYRARLAEGPTITLRQTKDSLSWGYDPTALIGFDLQSTIYPAGEFSAPWGRLAVERGGVLVQNDFSRIRVGVPANAIAPATRRVEGTGWTLTLNSGWSLRPDPSRVGSYVVVAAAP